VHIQYEYGLFIHSNPYIDHFSILINQVKSPKVFTLHSLLVPISPKPLTGGLLKDLELGLRNMLYAPFNNQLWLERFYAKADHLFLLNRRDALILEGLGVKKENISMDLPPVIRHAVCGNGSLAVDKYGLKDKIILTIFGFINQAKGYEVALESMQGLGDNVCLVIAGGLQRNSGASYLRQLQRLIRIKNLEKRVVVTGYLSEEDAAGIMAASNIVLAPFTNTNGSGSMGIGIAYHKPIIASDLSPNKEVYDACACIELFRSGDASDLRDKINKLLSSRMLRDELSRSAEKYCLKYNYERLSEKTMEIYHKLSSCGGYKSNV
jgi:glycosyltransferase involved in cell wall biosynthesis